MSVTSVRLQKELETPLDDLAKKLHRSKNWLINQAVKQLVERDVLEEKRWTETLEALDSVEQGRLVEGDEVHQWLESWGKDDELLPPSA